jgi:hypothetical protein
MFNARYSTQNLNYSYNLKSGSQQILLDWQGYILESDDTLFNTSVLKHRPISEWSNFVESVFPYLHKLNLDSGEIYFPRITSVTNSLEGLFDCSFMRVEWGENTHVLVWNIYDNKSQFELIFALQQRLNEILLRDLS